MKSAAPQFSQLFISRCLDLRFLAELRRAYPDSRSIYWDPALAGHGALELAASMAERVVVQDGLPVSLELDGDRRPVAFSDFDRDLAARMLAVMPSEQRAGLSTEPEPFPVRRGPVLFCPSNDTHAKLFERIARHLTSTRFLYHDRRPEERAQEMMESLGIPYYEDHPGSLAELAPSVLVVGNDWYDGAWKLFERAYAAGIPTVCIQEGCLDFSTHGRMQHCDYAFLQGPKMLDQLPAGAHFLAGNPRFESIPKRPLPDRPVAMLNCNFTYGVEESHRETWVGDVAKACQSLGVEYFLSQHPRDQGVFPEHPVRPSHAGVVHDHLAACSVLVTRFSTLVYEAMRAGRRVIYYNPHGERMRLFNEDDTGGLLKASDPAGLREALAVAAGPASSVLDAQREAFLQWHCGDDDGRAAFRCAGGLAAIANHASPRTANNRRDWWALWRQRRARSVSVALRSRRLALRSSLSTLKRRWLGTAAPAPRGSDPR